MKQCLLLAHLLCAGYIISAQDSTINSQTAGTKKCILVFNSFYPESVSAREPKRQLFVSLTDSVKKFLSQKIQTWSNDTVIIIPGHIPDTTKSDSVVYSLMALHHATWAIDVQLLNAYFDKTDVNVETVDGHKDRTASFDICAAITYKIVGPGAARGIFPVKNCENFGSRSVFSGFLAGGPDIVAKKKYAFDIVDKNAAGFLTETALKLFGK